jgi:hypothetical protein
MSNQTGNKRRTIVVAKADMPLEDWLKQLGALSPAAAPGVTPAAAPGVTPAPRAKTSFIRTVIVLAIILAVIVAPVVRTLLHAQCSDSLGDDDDDASAEPVMPWSSIASWLRTSDGNASSGDDRVDL